jgi:phospholipase C
MGPRFTSLLLLVCLAACTKKDEEEQPLPNVLPGPAEWNRPVTPPSDADAKKARAACTYKKDALPAETEGASYPMGSAIPIDHILVVMMENRSFDHYFQKLPEYGQKAAEVAPATFSNPDKNNMPVPIFHTSDFCVLDTNHEWNGTHEQLNGGKMDGFVKTSDLTGSPPPGGTAEMLSGKRAMGYFDDKDLPFYYWLANEFALGDRYFSSLPGPTFPNRYFMYSATAFGIIGNELPPPNQLLIFDYLELRQLNWKIYKDKNCQSGIGPYASKAGTYNSEGHLLAFEDFLADAKAGKLPQVAFIDPKLGTCTGEIDGNDEHPPSLPQTGQNFVATVIDALTKSPNWGRSALFLTYDEHGGFYDHVVPPPACKPDAIEPKLGAGDFKAGFDQYGPRVPFVVVSPFAKKHYVSHEVYDHTSILRFIEARFVIPAMTARDANALAPFDMFDFAAPPHATAPAITIPPVPTAAITACKAIFGK